MLVLSSRRGGMRIGAGDSAMRARLFHLVLGLAAALLPVAVRAQAPHPIPESERWATITHPGNEPYVTGEPRPGRLVGRVDYEYQISRTEVTGAEWFEFVQAYAPYIDEAEWTSFTFRSSLVGVSGYRQLFLPAENANRPVDVSWHYAARYVNWLHNGKALTPEAFENGVYDTSTFGQYPDGSWTDQATHAPGATYWIPTVDEWSKAAYFDPDRHGPGMPGYWLYPDSSDTQPLPGSPANGGETSTGGRGAFALPDVAAYRDVQSPWGLWDCSGGRAERAEDAIYFSFATGLVSRRLMGSDYNDNYLDTTIQRWDVMDGSRSSGPVSLFGLRLARAVPGPAGVGVCACALSLALRRRRQIDESPSSHLDRLRDVRVRGPVS